MTSLLCTRGLVMADTAEHLRQAIIDEIIHKVSLELSPEENGACAEFIRQFYGTVATSDLEAKNIDDLYGSALSFWHFIQKRAPGELKMRIYNPSYEQHGWQSTHTIIELIKDDMPFLVDSITMEINRMDLTVNLIIHMGGLRVERDKQHQLKNILPRNNSVDKNFIEEAPIYLEISRQTDTKVLEQLKTNLERVLAEVQAAVVDWQPMSKRAAACIGELEKVKQSLEPDDFAESIDFIRWLGDDHFTFLGVRDYVLAEDKGEQVLKVVPGSGLGILRDEHKGTPERYLSTMTPEARAQALSKKILIISKTNNRSTVHRPTYMDYIGVKTFNEKGEVAGEVRLIGLYTSTAYYASPRYIPLLRMKVATVMQNAGVGAKSHAGKALLNILETLPRDDLFQGSAEELLKIAMGIFQMQERRAIKMFARKDIYGRFISCLIYVPRDRYHTELRIDMQQVLQEAFHAQEITFTTQFSESVLARIHFLIRINPHEPVDYDFQEIENRLIEVGRAWEDDLKITLMDAFGEEEGHRLANLYTFSASYREHFAPRAAAYDIKHIERLSQQNNLELNFYQPLVSSTEEALRFKVYQYDETVILSDVLPILENMGLRVISERPYKVMQKNERTVWINDFSLQYAQGLSFPLEEIQKTFQEGFAKIWFEEAENDGFNKLTLATGLNWREVTVLRAYAKYLRQTGFTFSQEYIEAAVNHHPDIAIDLVKLFLLQFDPAENPNRTEEAQHIKEKLIRALDNVANLDEDRIIRRYLDMICATVRTNYFQKLDNGQSKAYLSFKLDPHKIPDLPAPIPMFEIFVYSPRFEGVHLRGGKVARGGLRWSDRREDFRTEILDLMKTQQVKNALIVPTGAKGGFVPKKMPSNDRDAIFAEGKACYQNFIRGLLDLTDNLVEGQVVKPQNVICYDEDDPYLVVAADKGTATFSDTANAIAKEHQFWLKDAFASGGSAGYDHKKIAITARGAWECVKRHFRQLNKNIEVNDFTVIGIGDMAGDVFGNGMLLSRHIQLVGAFNHLHIFLDPNPNPENSFKERERLFNLPRSAWDDYNAELISKGGGVFNRSAKSIKLTPEIKQLLGLKQDFIVPNELIQAMLRAPVDLLWNGGIGTFVKAKNETHADVGDRTNDGIRINGEELQCKVVGEGGNLGFTQLGRVEYALKGGKIYTDFIDNSGGVNCSDLEVNIKILLNAVVSNGDITEKQRDQLLVEMTEEIAQIVLYNNYQQSQAISIATVKSADNIELHSRYIRELEQSGKLVRAAEFLPDEKTLIERKLAGIGLTPPEIATLLAYSKIIAKEQILNSDVPEDHYLASTLENAFPEPLREKFRSQMQRHSLRREIIATQLCNAMFNEMGFSFIYRLNDETGAPVSAIVRAYTVARTIFNLNTHWRNLEALDNKVPATEQMMMMLQLMRFIRRSTRWILRNHRMDLNIVETTAQYTSAVQELKLCLPAILAQEDRLLFNEELEKYSAIGASRALAQELASIRPLYSALDIIEAANDLKLPIEKVAQTYFAIGELLDISWIRIQILNHVPENHWEALSREALRDDLDWQQRRLTIAILRHEEMGTLEDIAKLIDIWVDKYQLLIDRWRHLLADLRASASLNITMFFAAIRELLDLTQTSAQAANGRK